MNRADLPYIHKESVHYLPVKPLTNVYDYTDHVEVIMDMPGIDRNSLEVKISDRILNVSAKREIHHGGDLLLQEIRPIHFQRSFELAKDLDENSVTAEYYHGVLKIRIAKKPESRVREIKIQ
jgi:HSP20 family molecular chaperone IbpA